MKSAVKFTAMMCTFLTCINLTAAPAWAEAAAENSDTASGDEITVTARRREERLQDVPVSVSAFNQESLTAKGIGDVVDLGSKVPGLTITTAGGTRTALAFAIRGQRTNETQILTDPPVGLYFAEVNQPRTSGFGWAMYDLDSVQVLKGVQGTLFGRNMTGGAVLIDPARPRNEFQANIKAQYGSLDLKDLEGMVNVPLSEFAALRVAGKVHRRDGFMTDISNGKKYADEHYDSARASLLVESGNVSNLLIGDWLRSKNNSSGIVGDYSQNSGSFGTYSLINAVWAGQFGGTPNTPGNQIPNSPAYGSLAGRSVLSRVSDVASQIAAQRAIRNSDDPYRIVGLTPGSSDPFNYFGSPYEYVKNWGITNKTTIDVGNAQIKNIIAYRKVFVDLIHDLDGLPFSGLTSRNTKDTDLFSEEIQLQGSALGDRLKYTLGAFYFQEKGRDWTDTSTLPELSTAFGAPNTASARMTGARAHGSATSYAGYGAFTYSLTDQLKFSGGLRWTHDQRIAYPTPVGAPSLTSCTFDPKGLDNVLGTADDVTVAADCSVRAEKSWSAVTYDATLQWEPSDVTMAYASFRKGFRAGGFSLRASNAATLLPFDPETVYEYELGLKNQFNLGQLRLNTSAAAFYQDYRNVQQQNPTLIGGLVRTVIQNVAKQRITGGEIEANFQIKAFEGGISYAYVNVETLSTTPALANNFPQIGVPKHQASFFARVHLPIGEQNGDLVAGGDITFRSKIYHDDKDVGAIQPAYKVANARLDWNEVMGSKFSAGAFVKNLTNEFYTIGVIGLVAELGSGSSAYAEPRTYGVWVGYKF